jgi:hypothetical protein
MLGRGWWIEDANCSDTSRAPLSGRILCNAVPRAKAWLKPWAILFDDFMVQDLDLK